MVYVPTKEGHIHGSNVLKLLIRGHILSRTNFNITRRYCTLIGSLICLCQLKHRLMSWHLTRPRYSIIAVEYCVFKERCQSHSNPVVLDAHSQTSLAVIESIQASIERQRSYCLQQRGAQLVLIITSLCVTNLG